MLRRHASLILAISLIVLVATACIVRTGPRRSSGPPAYRGGPPPSDHRKGKHKKQKKQKKHKKHMHDAPRGDF